MLFTQLFESDFDKSKQNIAEGTSNVGARIKALCQKIYSQGDDEFEYFYNDSPIFAQYWDEYEGDLDSIIAEVDPGELQVMLDELESYVQQANLAEGDVAKLAGITALGIGAGLGANYLDQQQPRVEFDGKNGQVVRAYLEPAWTNRVPDNAMVIKGKDGKTYHVWSSAGKGMNSKSYHAAPVEPVKEGLTKTPSGDYINQHTGVRSSKPPVKKKRGEKTGAEWDAIEKAKKDKKQGVAEDEAGTKGFRVTWTEAGSDKHTSGLLLKPHAIEHAKMLKKKPGTSNVKIVPYRSVEEQGVAEGEVYDLEKEYGYEKPRSQPRRSAPDDYPYSREQDDDYFREIFRKQRLAKQKAEQDKDQGVAEDVKLPYPVRSEKLGRANMELLIRAYNQPTGPRTTLSFGDRILELDRDDIEAIAQYYDNVLKDDNARWNFISGVMSDPDGLTDTLVKLGRRKPGVARQPGLFQEADKKKEGNVKDVALQRAITKARGAFPTAGSDVEALSKGFMQDQEQDQQNFEKMRQADRRQDELLNQIKQIDQSQTQEIDDLEKDNNTVLRRLQQLQSVNAKLEKTLASMSGRGTKKSKSVDVTSPGSSGTASIAPTAEPKKAEKSKKEKDSKSKTSKPQAIAAPELPKIAPPEQPADTDAMSHVAKQLTTQNPDVLEPVIARSGAPRFNTSGAQDIVSRNIATDVRKNATTMANNMVGNKLQQDVDQELATAENKEPKPERPEADYGDDYQSMVKRVGQKAKQGPRKTVWDPEKRVYKTVPVNS